MENAYDEMEDYDHFVQELDDNMWGCLSWVAVFGLILLLLTLIILK